ncbi:diacylglycerol kinase family protein [Macrococcoides canis]|nr:diacylglycerol kinase [Macrococcus canis]UTH06032.1 diacylglycerol kinase family protein [Macrococcus canis]
MIKRFKHPIAGLVVLLQKDKNFLLHLIAAMGVILCGVIFNITATEWLFVIIAISTVLFMEVINTSVEYVVDLVTDEYHELAKYAKDTASLAVLIASFMSLFIGVIIFLPYLLKLF